MMINTIDTLSVPFYERGNVIGFFIGQGVNVEEVSSDCLSATEVYHPETPSSVQLYQVLNTHEDTHACMHTRTHTHTSVLVSLLPLTNITLL